jgi:cyanate permease
MLLGRLYGFGKIGILTGAINTVHFLGAGVWPFFAGLIFDLTGSYRLAFLLSAVMAAIAALCSYFIVEKRHTQNSAPGLA